MTGRVAVAIAVVLAVFAAAPVCADTWVIAPGKGTLVRFVSRAPMETFEGRSDRLSGTIACDPDAVGDSVAVRLEIDLASLDTGIDKRNRHMRENHLETDTYPTATFSGAAVAEPRGAALVAGRAVTFQVVGTLDLHGVARRTPASVTVTRTAEGDLEIAATLAVTLGDFSIERPRFLFLKLNETQEVTVTATALRQ